MKKVLFIVMTLLLLCSVVSAFGFEDLVGYVVKNNPPEVYLISPKNNAVADKLIFVWGYKDSEGDKQVQYLLQLDDDWRFESPYNFYGLSENTLEVELPLKEGAYFWRVRARDRYGWGEFSDWRRFDLDLSVKTCRDGTPFWQCSSDIPYYCDGGLLVEDCRRCGCDINEICQANGICLERVCSDGTRYGECSKYKPKYCKAGDLIDVCSICSCPEGLVCQPDGTCVVQVIIKEKPKEESKTVLEYIVTFFKRLFAGL